MILSYSGTEFFCFNASVLWLFQACLGIDSFNAAWVEPLIPFFLTDFVFSNICLLAARPFSIVLAFFSAFFGKTSIFFLFFLEKELLAFSVIFDDCDPDFSTQKDK